MAFNPERNTEREENGLTALDNQKLEALAARKRWNISDRVKEKVLVAIETALDGKNTSRKLKAGRLLKDLEAQNLADEHAQLKAGNGRSESDINAEIQAEIERRAAVADLAAGGQAAHAGSTESPQSDDADDADDPAAGLSGP